MKQSTPAVLDDQRSRGTEHVDPKSHKAFSERLKTALKNTGSSILSVAQTAGISDSTIHLWLKGSEPSREKLIALAEATGVSVEWLAIGHGEMRSNQIQGYIKPRSPKDRPPLAFERGWLDTHLGPLAKEWLQLFEVQDDSMEPTLRSGDLVLATQPTETWLDARNGIYLVGRTRARPGEKILAVDESSKPIGFRDAEPNERVIGKFLFDAKGRLANRAFARRIEFTGKPSAVIKCDNPAYSLDVEIDPENDQGLAILERVIWHGRLI